MRLLLRVTVFFLALGVVQECLAASAGVGAKAKKLLIDSTNYKKATGLSTYNTGGMDLTTAFMYIPVSTSGPSSQAVASIYIKDKSLIEAKKEYNLSVVLDGDDEEMVVFDGNFGILMYTISGEGNTSIVKGLESCETGICTIKFLKVNKKNKEKFVAKVSISGIADVTEADITTLEQRTYTEEMTADILYNSKSKIKAKIPKF